MQTRLSVMFWEKNWTYCPLALSLQGSCMFYLEGCVIQSDTVPCVDLFDAYWITWQTSHQISSFNGPQMLCLIGTNFKKDKKHFDAARRWLILLHFICRQPALCSVLVIKHRSHTHIVYYARCLHRAWTGLCNLLTWPFGCKMLTEFALKINYPAKILHGWSMFRTTRYCKW